MAAAVGFLPGCPSPTDSEVNRKQSSSIRELWKPFICPFIVLLLTAQKITDEALAWSRVCGACQRFVPSVAQRKHRAGCLIATDLL